MKKTKYLHIAIIILGIIFITIPVFHNNLWFDESYSVGMAAHNFGDIWNIGGNDVHPVLYYWILSIIGSITGGSIIAYRIFSLICIALLSILGYTHIRKDFGEKTGLLFSFFSLFLPEICLFANLSCITLYPPDSYFFYFIKLCKNFHIDKERQTIHFFAMHWEWHSFYA